VNTLSGRKFIFCVSPGRSGTHYLSQIFGLVRGVCSVHEPEHQFPKYSELKPHKWNLKQNLLSDSFTDRKQLKFWQIDDLMTTSHADTYVETNPMFCTLWHDVILSEASNYDIKVIILRRNSVDVLKSILDLGWYSERNGDHWMVSAYSANSLFSPPRNEVQASPTDYMIGHLVNAELYTQKITKTCLALGYDVIEVSSNDLFNDVESVLTLLSKCALETDRQKIQKILQSKHNKPAARKKYCDVPIELCTHEINEYLSACNKAEVKIPRLFFS